MERELLEDLKRVTGKQNLLFQLADAALAHPDGLVKDVVDPVISEVTLIGQGMEGHGPHVSDDLADVYPQFLPIALSADDSAPALDAGFSFQQ